MALTNNLTSPLTSDLTRPLTQGVVVENLLPNSNAMDSWANAGCVLTPNTDNDVWGALTADTCADNDAVGAPSFLQNMSSFISDVQYYVELWILDDSVGRGTRYPRIRFTVSGGSGANLDFNFDTDTGEYSAPVGLIDISTSLIAGYWRVRFSYIDVGTNTVGTIKIFPAIGTNWGVTGSITGSIVVGGVQVTTGSYGDFQKT